MVTEKTAEVTSEDTKNLEKFAEKSLQAVKLSEVMDKVPSLVQRGTIYLVGGALLVTAVLLYFGKVPVTIVAKGKIVSAGKTFSVQARDNCEVTEVLAKVGDRLQAGVPILRVDRSTNSSNLDMASLKRTLELRNKKMQGLRNAVNITQLILSNPEGFLKKDQQVLVDTNTMQKISTLRKSWMDMNNSRQLDKQGFQDKKKTLLKEVELKRQKIELQKNDKVRIAGDIEQKEKYLVKKKGDLDKFQEMVRKGFFSEQELRKEEESYYSSVSTIGQTIKQLEEVDLSISNDRLRLADLELKVETEEADSKKKYRLTVIAYNESLTALRLGLNERITEINNLEAEIKNSEDKLMELKSKMVIAEILMPIAGAIVEFEVQSPGEMISAGKVVARIAPAGEPLMVTAEVPNKDMGFVNEGLPAHIKVDAYPFQQFGVIPATVLQVFTNIGDKDNFTITLELSSDYILSGDRKIPLFSGLTVQAELVTKKQRLIKLILGKDKDEKGKGGK